MYSAQGIKELYILLLCGQSVQHGLWGPPLSSEDLELYADSYARKGSPEWQHRRDNAFNAFSLTVSAYALRAICSLTPYHGLEVSRAVTELKQWRDPDGGYGSSSHEVGPFNQKRKYINVTARHTAAALRLLTWSSQASPGYSQSINWLLSQQLTDGHNDCGGWTDDPRSQKADCCSTAMALGALSDHLQASGHSLSSEVTEKIRHAIAAGLNWLRRDYRGPDDQWQYLNTDLAIADTCLVIDNLLPLLAADWLNSEARHFIRSCISDLGARIDQDGREVYT